MSITMLRKKVMNFINTFFSWMSSSRKILPSTGFTLIDTGFSNSLPFSLLVHSSQTILAQTLFVFINCTYYCRISKFKYHCTLYFSQFKYDDTTVESPRIKWSTTRLFGLVSWRQIRFQKSTTAMLTIKAIASVHGAKWNVARYGMANGSPERL